MKKIRLFCFPYAGGSSNIYLKWEKYLDKSIELYPVEISGRLRRFNEPLNTNMDMVIDDAYNAIKDRLDEMPYIIFGHSMGSIIAGEIVDLAYQNSHQKPAHVFLSGRNPLHYESNHSYNKLPCNEFVEKIIDIGGTQKEIFENKELRDLFVPILRADFEAVENYKRKSKGYKWDVDLTVLNGKEDNLIDKKRIPEWGKYTKKKCQFYYFNGDHFYINDNFKEIISLINKTRYLIE